MIKVGMLGGSEGNGHPYSWSAIINGFDENEMKRTAFPNIYNYLCERQFPKEQIKGAEVSHIWTQELQLSKSIQRCCGIANVVENYSEMIGSVDCVILARDDFENHLQMSLPFLDAGLPVFIDKPLEITVAKTNHLLSHEKYPGQIFSCTCLRYAKELFLSQQEVNSIGRIKHYECSTIKSWEKYAIHIIEPVIASLPSETEIVNVENTSTKNKTSVYVSFENRMTASFEALGGHIKNGNISITYHGEHDSITKCFSDPFSAFKTGLQIFLKNVISPSRVIPFEEILNVARILEGGIKYEP